METKKYELIQDAIGYAVPSTAKGKIIKNPENIYIGRATKLDGRIVFVRTADGFKKMMETTANTRYKYFDASMFKLYVPSSSSGDIATTNPVSSTKSSFDGIDLPNSDKLSDDFSSIKGRTYLTKKDYWDQRYFDGSEEKSNAIGDFFNQIFDKDAEGGKLADEKKVVYSEAEAKKLHEKSGSKTPFKDWVNSDSSKQFLTSLANFGSVLLNNNANKYGGATTPPPVNTGGDDVDETKSTTIMGMHPITFTVVALTVSIGGFFGVRYFIKKGAKAKTV